MTFQYNKPAEYSMTWFCFCMCFVMLCLSQLVVPRDPPATINVICPSPNVLRPPSSVTWQNPDGVRVRLGFEGNGIAGQISPPSDVQLARGAQ